MKRQSFSLDGRPVRPGEMRDGHLQLSENYTGDPVRMPVRVIRARRPGPTVLVTAAIHGDEINGTGVIHDFLFGEAPALMAGTLVLVPVVNVLGLELNDRYLPDRRDLNRSFPGQPNGSLAARIAHRLMEGLVTQCDFAIDLHSAAAQRTNYPNVRADLGVPACRRLAAAFGAALVVDGKGPVGSFRREATRAGCPTIILEAGEPLKIEPGVLRLGVRGITNVLMDLGMLAGTMSTPPFEVFVRRTTWLRASAGGILKFHVRPGDFVDDGTVVATHCSLMGAGLATLKTASPGIVIGMTTMPAVKPGEPVCHLAVLSARQVARFRRLRDRAGRDVHERVRRDLATNMDVVPAEE